MGEERADVRDKREVEEFMANPQGKVVDQAAEDAEILKEHEDVILQQGREKRKAARLAYAQDMAKRVGEYVAGGLVRKEQGLPPAAAVGPLISDGVGEPATKSEQKADDEQKAYSKADSKRHR